MIVCPDCRTPLSALGERCRKCDWVSINKGCFFDFLGSRDRRSTEIANYIDTYDVLAERNMLIPVESNSYVANLASRFCARLGNLKDKDFCDVGAGRGYLIGSVLAKSPASVTAVDIAAPSLANVVQTHGVRGVLANAENLPFEREFDVITATDILEHVLNMGNFLVTANWALRDGGVLGVRVPYLENLILYSNFHGLPMHFTHLRTFNKQLLVQLIESAGFRVWDVHFDGFNVNYPQEYLCRYPRLCRRVMAIVRRSFGADDDVTLINPKLGRLLMKPIEIGVVARKVAHLGVVDAHASLAEFYAVRKKGQQQKRASLCN